MYDEEYYMHYCQIAYDHGYQVNTHAIGDEANRFMLYAYSRFLKKTMTADGGLSMPRWFILKISNYLEHTQSFPPFSPHMPLQICIGHRIELVKDG
jgi:predicted amidohydrolase YtcJ